MSKVIYLKDYEDRRLTLAVARMTPEQLYKQGLQLAVASMASESYHADIIKEIKEGIFNYDKREE